MNVCENRACTLNWRLAALQLCWPSGGDGGGSGSGVRVHRAKRAAAAECCTNARPLRAKK